MRLLAFLLFFLSLEVFNAAEQPYPVGDIRNCLQSPVSSAEPSGAATVATPYLRMEALPGTGFDNLLNKDMGQILDYSYSLCKMTNDERYLIPDSVFVIPVQSSKFESYADMFDHWDNYTSMTSVSVNVDVSAFSMISGKFSSEYQHVKKQQVNNKAKTTRVQIRENLYTVKMQPGSRLNNNFRNRLLDIGAYLQSNDTEYAVYTSDMLVRDFGTHVITSVEAGALMAQVDSVSSEYVANQASDSSSISASASASFFNKLFSFSAGFGVKTSSSQTTAYEEQRYHSQVTTIGGPPYKTDMTVNDWEEGVPNALVAIDRVGDPIHFLISPETLPELPEPIVYEVLDAVYSAVTRYYRVNTHHGCTNLNSPNFRYEANVDDGTCEAPFTSFQFGGVYQQCQVTPTQNYEDLCTQYGAQENPLTGTYSCPSGYESIELHSGTISHVAKKEVCNNQCHHCGFMGWSRCCQCVSAWVNTLSSASYQAYWCVDTGKVPPNSGYMFGGLYTVSSVNPVTRAKTCPKHFYPIHIGYEIEVCVSDSYDLAYEYSVPFGGFFSCEAANPLTATSGSVGTKSCPKHYSSILASLDQGCEINYCAKLQENYGISSPRLPPYKSKPSSPKNKTETVMIMGAYGELWLKNESGDWVKSNTHEDVDTGDELMALLLTPEEASDLPSTEPISSGGLSAGAIVGITIAAVVVAATTVVVIVYGLYGILRKKKGKSLSKSFHASATTSYLAINSTTEEASPEEPPIVNEA